MATEKRLIDANDAQERLCAVCKNAFPGPCHPDYCNFADAIRDSKTVDAVHGRWLQCQWKWDFECSVCRMYAVQDMSGNYSIKTDYCPHCGAKMDGDGDD